MNIKKLDIVVLCFLIVILIITRVSYLNWGLPNNIHPYSYHPDEAKQLDSIANMHPGQLDFNPDEFIYPSLQYYINALALETFSLIGYVHLVPDITFYIHNPAELAKLFLVGRFVTLLFSIGTIILVYLIGKRLYGTKVGMLAAVILSIIPAFAIESHYMTVDVPLTFWIALTLFLSTFILKEDKWWPYILAGLSSGFATATKYPGVFAWFFVLGAHILRERPLINQIITNEQILIGPFRTWLKYSFDKKIMTSLTFLILGFFLASPYVFIDYQHSIPAIVGQWNLGHTTQFDNIGGNGLQYHKFTYLLFAAFPYMMGIALYGLLMITIFMQPNKKHFMLLLSFVIPFFLLFATSRFVMIRYYLPLLPMSALMISAPFSKPDLSKYFKMLFIVVMVVTTLMLIGQNRKFEVDTRDEAYFWIKDNIPVNSTLLVSDWAPLRYTPFRDSAALSCREVNDSEILKIRSLDSPENIEGYKVLTLFNASDTETLRFEPDYIIITSLDWSEYYRNQSTDIDYQKGLNFYEQIREGQDWRLIKSFDRTYFGESIYVALDPRFKSSYASPRIEVYEKINHSQVKA